MRSVPEKGVPMEWVRWRRLQGTAWATDMFRTRCNGARVQALEGSLQVIREGVVAAKNVKYVIENDHGRRDV